MLQESHTLRLQQGQQHEVTPMLHPSVHSGESHIQHTHVPKFTRTTTEQEGRRTQAEGRQNPGGDGAESEGAACSRMQGPERVAGGSTRGHRGDTPPSQTQTAYPPL